MKTESPRPEGRRAGWWQRLGACFCAAALLVSALPVVQAQNDLPALGDPSSDDFEIGTERKLGDRIMREIRADPDYLDDPLLREYLQSLWQPLLAQARARGNIAADIDQRLAWEAFLVRDKEVNAFALPGGFVGVNLGLIAMTATRDELASVLAHELSHVTQRHIARSIASQKQQSLVGLAALVLGLLAASQGGADAAQAAIVGGQAAAMQGMLNFSRDMEREADRTGFSLMAGAGFAPAGMAAMFEKLDQASRMNDSGGFPYLRSHPLTAERIGEARGRLGAATPTAPVSVLEHTVAQARARVLMDTRVDALRRWQSLDGDRVTTGLAERLAGACESALASTLLRDWGRADASLAEALALLRSPGSGNRPAADANNQRAERAVQLLRVQSLLARGDAAGAAASLQPYAGDASRPSTLLAAQVALAETARAVPTAAAESALKQRAADLQTWVAVNPDDALAWGTLSQLWSRLGQPLRAIRAEAEARIAIGDLAGGADRLRAGQARALAGGAVDFIDASVIDSRLRTVEAQRRQLLADEKSERF